MAADAWTPYDRERLQLEAIDRWAALRPSAKNRRLSEARHRAGVTEPVTPTIPQRPYYRATRHDALTVSR